MRFVLPNLLRAVFAAALFVGGSGQCVAAVEAGHPFVRNFTPRDYGARSQNWAAAQDAQGLMYFANQGVVLQYDGVSWQKVVVNQVTDVIRGLAADPATGTVYAGGLNEVGFLTRGAGDEMRFQSLVEHLPADAREFRAVHRIYATPQGVFFAAEKQIMRWRDGRFEVWKLPAVGLLRTFWVDDQFYAQEPSVGLLRLEGEQFVAASTDPVFNRAVVMTMVPNTEGSVTVGTLRDGLFTLRGGSAVPWTGELNDFCKAREIRRGLRLSDGSLALATASSGVLRLDAAGNFRDRWDQAAGVQNDSATDLFEDREGGVWLCLSTGLTRVEAMSPLTVFDRESGLKPALLHSMGRMGGTFYVAGGAGLFRLMPADPAHAVPARAERVPGLDTDCWSLCEFDGRLLVADQAGVLQLDAAGQVSRVFSGGFSGGCLARSRTEPERVFLGRRRELRSLRFDATSQRWVDEGVIPGAEGETHTMAQTADGDLWLGTNDHGVLRVHFAPSGDGVSRGAATVTLVSAKDGALGRESWTRTVEGPGDDVLVGSRAGMFRLDAARTGLEPAGQYGANFVGGAFRFDDIAPDARGSLWFNVRAANGVWLEQELGRAGRFAAPESPAARQTLSQQIISRINVVDCIFVEDGAFWVAGPGGVVRLDIAQWERTPPAVGFATLIRRADASRDSAPTGTTSLAPSGTLPFARNSVRFRLAANTFTTDSNLRYRTRLTGFGDGAWSNFDPRTEAEYTNLPEGRYVFEAVARDPDGRIGVAAKLPFQVLPPPYRTAWAYAGYLLAATAGVVGIVRWRLRGLRAANVRLEGLVADRTADLRAHEDELVRARDDAEAANRAKSAFLANMSHELRTPLNAILGYTQIMLKEPGNSPRNRERLTVVGQSGAYLLTMINEVLDLSKIEAGKLTLQPTGFRLAQTLEDVAATFRHQLLEKGLEFRASHAPDLPGTVHADEGKLRQVLFNLLSNAVKFTRRGAVALEVTRAENGRVRFVVNDTGLGIAAGELRNIFEAFHQVGDAKLAAQGTGLGLAISQRLVGLLGGKLQVESTPGEGSRFWFELELAAVAPAASDMLPAMSPVEYGRVTGYEGLRRTLLVVDDEPANRYVLRGLLEPLGFHIEEATGGATCLEWCARQMPDAVLLDLRMDWPDGCEVARRLRAAPHGAKVRIVAVSASVFDDHRQQAIDAGCDAFLPKPFQEAQLFAVIGRLLELRWISTPDEAAPDDTVADDEADFDTAPPVAEIDAMLELSRRGDILGIKKRLSALQTVAPHGSCRTLVRGLEPLVAGYQMDRIRDVLNRFKENAKP